MIRLIVLFSCLSMTLFAATKTEQMSWNQKMLSLKKNLIEINSYLVSENTVKKSQKELKSKVRELRKTVESLSDAEWKKKMSMLPSSDPSLKIFANAFSRRLRHVEESLDAEAYGYAKDLMATTGSFCFSCHTSNSYGPRFIKWREEITIPKTADLLERADFLIAFRYFEEAQAEYRKFLDNKKNYEKNRPEWEKTLRKSLLLAVRGQNNLALAIEITDAALKLVGKKAKETTDRLKDWKKQLLSWKAQQPRIPTEEKKHFAFIKDLFEESFDKEYAQGQWQSEIEFYRATALAHNFLRIHPSSKHTADVLFLLGQGYERIRSSTGLWGVHEDFYESCIQRQPHSAIATQCFEAYKTSLEFGFSGSRGLDLPPNVQEELKKLKNKATTL